MNRSPKLTQPIRTALFLLVLAAQVISSNRACAWGQNGHRITSEIAERNLTPATREALAKILPGRESLAEISTWADYIRSDPSWDFIQVWHYISIDDDETFDNLQRDEAGDLLAALNNLEAFLRDHSATELTLEAPAKKRRGESPLPITQKRVIGKREALALFVHFVGDLHQPLHVGRRDDQGGNRIQVEWFDEEITLHRLWDEALIESQELSYTEFTEMLNRGSTIDIAEWQSGTFLDWAKESKAARDLIYDFGAQRSSWFLNVKEPPSLGYDYRARTVDLLKARLQKGGFRLAAKLNSIFAAKP